MTHKELVESKKYVLVKISKERGYVSRKLTESETIAHKYDGKYGKGYYTLRPRYDTTRYCDKWYFVNR